MVVVDYFVWFIYGKFEFIFRLCEMRENDYLSKLIEVRGECCIIVKDNWKYGENYWYVCGNVDLKCNFIIIYEFFWWNLEDEFGCYIIVFVEY